MCFDPVSLALMAGSAYANKRGQKAVRKKQNSISEGENMRQAVYQKRAQDTFDTTSQKLDRPSQDQALTTTSTQREAAIQNTQAQAGDYAPTTGSAPAVVKSEIAKRMADVIAKGRGEVAARAKLGAYGGVQDANAINLNRSGQDINQMTDFSRGSASIVPLEMQASLGAGRKWSNIADVMRLAGMGTSLYGAMQPAPLNYATTPAQFAPNGMTYTDPNDLVQARKLGLIR